MRNHAKELHQQNQALKRRSGANYALLLSTVLRTSAVPGRDDLSALVKPFLDGTATKESTAALYRYCDELSGTVFATAEETFSAHQFASLVKKYPFPKDLNPFDPKEAAASAFAKSEHRCKRISQRFKAARAGKPRPFSSELHHMRGFISHVLGRLDLDRVLGRCNFGPGASIGVNSSFCNVGRKIDSKWTVSAGAYYYGYWAVCRIPSLRESFLKEPDLAYGPPDLFRAFRNQVAVVGYNKIAFVPKTAKTHRSIAVEPLLNGFVQKGVDEEMRLKLKRIGLDLSDQSRNSEFARLGSTRVHADPFVTLDLSSASDSISIGLVSDLLPPEWFEFLNSIRSRSYLLDGVVRRYEKFCSMGNGFCFPLETLLFAAVCSASGAGTPGKDFLVYGDDIIVRASVAEKVINLLGHCGFRLNKSKSFTQGPFRESCGADWFDGEDVRPFTLDYALDSVQNVFKALNGMQRNRRSSCFFGAARSLLTNALWHKWLFFRPFPGPEDSAITSVGDEHLTSSHCIYLSKSMRWSWRELITSSVPDRQMENIARERLPSALMFAALCGSTSTLPFAVRRKTSTKVRRISHPGATSQWLPAPRLVRPWELSPE